MKKDYILAALRAAQEYVKTPNQVGQMAAELIAGRLKATDVNKRVLCELKRELKDFNMNTWEWK